MQQPRPPVLIGGSGERKTLRLVAQYADACNLFGGAPDVVAHKLDVLRRHCDDAGRDYDDDREDHARHGATRSADPDGFLREMAAYADLGISLVTTMPSGDDPVAWTTAVCERVLPRLGEVGAQRSAG